MNHPRYASTERASFASAWAKLGRAQTHRADFVQVASKWAGEINRKHLPPIEKVTESAGDGEVIVFRVSPPTVQVPDSLRLILGDALTNFRAALDHAAWELAATTGVPPLRPTQIYFPITGNRAKFDEVVGRMLPNVSPVAVGIIQRAQPFHNQAQAHRHPLSLLKSAVDSDKHRVLAVVALAPARMNAEVKVGNFPNFLVDRIEPSQHHEAMLPGTELLRIYGKRIRPDADHGVSVRWREAHELPCLEDGFPIELLLANASIFIEDLLKSLTPYLP